MPARASDSAAVPNEAPTGTVTRTGRPGVRAHATTVAAMPTPTSAERAAQSKRGDHLPFVSTLTRERMLQQDGCGECIDISFPTPRRATHLADSALRGSGRVPLIDQLDAQTGAALQFLGNAPYFARAVRVLSILVERQSDNEAARLELARAANELGDWRTLACPSKNEAGGRSNYPHRITDGESDSSLTIIDGQ